LVLHKPLVFHYFSIFPAGTRQFHSSPADIQSEEKAMARMGTTQDLQGADGQVQGRDDMRLLPDNLPVAQLEAKIGRVAESADFATPCLHPLRCHLTR